MKHSIAAWVLSVFSGCFFFCSAVFGQYQVIDLGTCGGNRSVAYSINDNGQIVGQSDGSAGLHATLFDPTGAGNNCDLVPFDWDDSFYQSVAYSISNNGQIVGVTKGGDHYQAYPYDRATLFDPTGCGNSQYLNGVPSLYNFGNWAYSINDNGQIVGQSASSDGTGSHATLFNSSPENRDLGTLGGNTSFANSINNNGQIVGFAQKSGGASATLFDPTGAGHNQDLSPSFYSESQANSINNNGQIVGWAGGRAALFDINGVRNPTDLGILSGKAYSVAYSINDNGQIVGGAYNGSSHDYDPFYNDVHDTSAVLFDPTGRGNNIDLNTLIAQDSGWTLYEAYSINDNGWIVGYGSNPVGLDHAYLLKPIPEPCMLALLVFGGLTIMRKQRN